VRDIANASGSSVYHTGYDAFGAKVSESGAGADRWGFTGREHDTDTGLRYHRARYVDLVLGRWMSNDPIGFDAGDVNLYRYVRNSPTAFTDPLGQQVYIVPSAPWGLHMNIVAYASLRRRGPRGCRLWATSPILGRPCSYHHRAPRLDSAVQRDPCLLRV
jgi:RHS repeat-associated protein